MRRIRRNQQDDFAAASLEASHNQVADEHYEPEDCHAITEASQGTAITHEQVSDTFTTGNNE